MNVKKRCAQQVAKTVGLNHAALFSSCRNGLHALLDSLKLKAKDQVIVQDFICESIPLAVQASGASCRRVPVNPQTLNLCVEQVKYALNSRTKVVLFVHGYGSPCGVVEMAALCRKHNLVLIEDISHAVGATVNGRKVGSFGDYAVFSFTKQMVNVGGGAVLSHHSLRDVILSRHRLHQRSSLRKKQASLVTKSIERVLASLYDTRGFFPSKMLIDYAKGSRKGVHVLDTTYLCTTASAALALVQLPFLLGNQQRCRNLLFAQAPGYGKSVGTGNVCSGKYLTFIAPKTATAQQQKAFMNYERLLHPAWTPSSMKNRVTFMPVHASMKPQKIKKVVRAYNKVYKASFRSQQYAYE